MVDSEMETFVRPFFTVSGSTLLRENVFILVLVYPDFLLALEPGEKKLRQEKKIRGRRKKFQAGEKGFFFLLVRHSGFRLTRLNDQIALWSSGDLLFLKLPFAVRPGLTGSRVSKDAKQFRLNLWVPGWLDGLNSQVSWGLGWPPLEMYI